MDGAAQDVERDGVGVDRQAHVGVGGTNRDRAVTVSVGLEPDVDRGGSGRIDAVAVVSNAVSVRVEERLLGRRLGNESGQKEEQGDEAENEGARVPAHCRHLPLSRGASGRLAARDYLITVATLPWPVNPSRRSWECAAEPDIPVGPVNFLTQARLQVLAAALLFPVGGAGIKACALTSWQVASFRSGIAAIVVWILMPAARRFWAPRVALPSLAY